MLPSNRLVSAVLLSSLLAPFTFAAHTHLPVPSTWTLNLGESSFGSGPSMKSDVFVMAADTEKRAKYTDSMVDADGKTWKSSWSGPADGTPHPVTGMPGATFSTNAATDVSIMTLPDGTAITCDFSLSADNKKFTNKCVAKSKDGKEANQTIVYDRTK
ncbi:MAG: hypothetical protein NVSMB3_15660 [Acidobacteriaceae bacterium]